MSRPGEVTSTEWFAAWLRYEESLSKAPRNGSGTEGALKREAESRAALRAAEEEYREAERRRVKERLPWLEEG